VRESWRENVKEAFLRSDYELCLTAKVKCPLQGDVTTEKGKMCVFEKIGKKVSVEFGEEKAESKRGNIILKCMCFI